MNNNLSDSSMKICKCGRRPKLGEEKHLKPFGYVCPDCLHRERAKPLTREEYYRYFGIEVRE